jgi:phosphoglycolate phosphatase
MNYFYIILGICSGLGIAAWLKQANKVCLSGNLSRLKPPLAIFDFDGTICPSFHLFIEHLNALSDRFGHRKVRPDEIENLRNMSARKVVSALGVSRLKLPFLIRRIRLNAQKQLLELDPLPGLAEVIRNFKEKGVSLGILTSNTEVNVRLYLQKYNIDCFDFIYSGNNVFGKRAHLMTILKKSGLKPKQAAYVGDEARDMEAAKSAGVKAIAVSWGYNSKTALLESAPDRIVDSPIQLLSTELQIDCNLSASIPS